MTTTLRPPIKELLSLPPGRISHRQSSKAFCNKRLFIELALGPSLCSARLNCCSAQCYARASWCEVQLSRPDFAGRHKVLADLGAHCSVTDLVTNLVIALSLIWVTDLDAELGPTGCRGQLDRTGRSIRLSCSFECQPP
ncbi:hypothetical protein U1Q18_044117 [Sarracenia purpurea var. burkii]